METNNKQRNKPATQEHSHEDCEGHCDPCYQTCSMPGWGHGRHIFLRLILGIFILLLVFWMGLKIGEFKGEFGYNDSFGHMPGFRTMMWRGDDNTGPGMMKYYYQAATSTTPVIKK